MSTVLSPTGTTSPPPPYEPRRPCIAVLSVFPKHTLLDLYPITNAMLAEHIPIVHIGRRDMLNAAEIINSVQPSAVLLIEASLYRVLRLNIWDFLTSYVCKGGTLIFLSDYPRPERQPGGRGLFSALGINWDAQTPCNWVFSVNKGIAPRQTAREIEERGLTRMDATPMSGVSRRHNWMSCEGCARLGGHGGCSVGSVVAFAQVEGGSIGYVGFLDDSEVVALCVMGMCGLMD